MRCPERLEKQRKIKTWFGYRVHLIADTRYEIPVACRVRRASRSEVKQLEAMMEELFEETPYGSPSWKRGYRGRSALERIYSRLHNDFGFERHFLRGRSRMTARVGLALTVMMALALAGRRDRMRSLVGAVPFADTG